MTEYVMAIKERNAGDNRLNGVIWKTEARELSEAKQYFVKLKALSEEAFDQLFVVTEVKK